MPIGVVPTVLAFAWCRWYLGTVKGYDARTKKHRVAYKDGDVKLLALRHEAVLIAEDSPVSPVVSAPAASPQAATPATTSPAANGRQPVASGGSTPGGDTPRSGRRAQRTPGSSGRKAAAAPKPAPQPTAQTPVSEASPEPRVDSSSSDSDSDGSQAAAPVLRRPNADRRRDRQRRRDPRDSGSGRGAGGNVNLNGVSKVSGSSAAKPRPDTKAGRAARRASGGKPGKASAADDAAAAEGPQPSSAAATTANAAAAAPVNGKRSRADEGAAAGSPPKVARVDTDTPPQQAPRQPAAPAKQPAAASQQPPAQHLKQQSGLAGAGLPAQPQGVVSRTAAGIVNGTAVGMPPNGVALGPVAAFKAALSGAAPATAAAQPRSQPQPPRSGLQAGKPHPPHNGKQPQNGKPQQPPPQQQQLLPAVCMPPPPPVSTVGFSPKATTLQVLRHFALALARTGLLSVSSHDIHGCNSFCAEACDGWLSSRVSAAG